MTINTLDSVSSWFGEKLSFSMKGMQGNAKEEEEVTRVPIIRRATRYNSFPPPLESPTLCDGNFSHLHQVERVCFTSVRRGGRLVLLEKPQPLPPHQSIIRSQRHDGRLQLRLYIDQTSQNQHQRESPIAEALSLKHEEHNSLPEISQLNHIPFAEDALLPRHHPKQKPLERSVASKHNTQDLHAMQALQEQHSLAMSTASSGNRYLHAPIKKGFSPEQDQPSRSVNNPSHGRPSTKGLLPGPVQDNTCAEFGKEQNSRAENARRVQEQCRFEHHQQNPITGSSSPFARIASSDEQHQRSPMVESSSPKRSQQIPNTESKRQQSPPATSASPPQRFQHSPNGGSEREEIPDADVARKRNPTAQTASPIAEADRRSKPSAENARRWNPSIAEHAATKKAQLKRAKKGKEEKAKQENERRVRDSLKQSRVQLKCDAYRNSGYTTQGFKPYEIFALKTTRSLAYSLRPLCMLNF